MSLIRGMTTKSDKHKTCELFAEIDWIPLWMWKNLIDFYKFNTLKQAFKKNSYLQWIVRRPVNSWIYKTLCKLEKNVQAHEEERLHSNHLSIRAPPTYSSDKRSRVRYARGFSLFWFPFPSSWRDQNSHSFLRSPHIICKPETFDSFINPTARRMVVFSWKKYQTATVSLSFLQYSDR